MKILIAPDSFKGSLSADAVCEAMAKGIRTARPDAKLVKIPLSDGGEGFVSCIRSLLGGQEIRTEVTLPMGETGSASYLLLPDKETAVIEMATVCGLTLVPESTRNPMKATTYGLGQLIAHALSLPVKRILIGLGGSATNDGGAGMLTALGAVFKDAEGRPIRPGAEGLADLAEADFSQMKDLSQVEILAACDVTNPLCGENGASRIFGPQKGASPREAEEMDALLARYARITGIRPDRPGAGAAGGTGAALLEKAGAAFRSGIDLMLELCDFKTLLKTADAVFTGEGHTDRQSTEGKAVSGVAGAAASQKVPVICVSGAIDSKGAAPLYAMGVTAMFSVANGPMTLEESVKNTAALLEDRCRNIAALLCPARPDPPREPETNGSAPRARGKEQPRIETDRLELIPLNARQLRDLLEDLPALEKELNCLYRAEPPEGEFRLITEQQLAITEKDPDNYPWHSFWLMIRKEDRVAVGSADFKDLPDEAGETEIGYGLGKGFEHRGYMTETVKAMCAWALRQEGVLHILAETEPDAAASQRVLQRCGFREYRRDATSHWRL